MGEITKKLLSKWSENVGLDIVQQQIRNYSLEVQEYNSSAPTPYKF